MVLENIYCLPNVQTHCVFQKCVNRNGWTCICSECRIVQILHLCEWLYTINNESILQFSTFDLYMSFTWLFHPLFSGKIDVKVIYRKYICSKMFISHGIWFCLLVVHFSYLIAASNIYITDVAVNNAEKGTTILYNLQNGIWKYNSTSHNSFMSILSHQLPSVCPKL